MTTPEQELKRLLHLGCQLPVYNAGDKVLDDSYRISLMSAIESLLEAKKNTEAASCIIKAFSDGYSAHPAMLVYALVVCIKQTKCEPLRVASYKALRTVCSSPENLFLFIKYAVKLSQNNSIGGKGWRKVCRDWYLKKDVKALAESVGYFKKRHGWMHKDIIRLIHLNPSKEPARAAIIKYLLFDIKKAKNEFGENPEASEVLNYLQGVEDFRRLTDEQQAARSIEAHKYTLEHVSSNLMKSREVWSALVGNIPLLTLLKNLERIGYLGFLKPNSALVKKIVDALKDENAIAESHLHPAQVYVTLRSYEMSWKFEVAERARKSKRFENGRGNTKKTVKVPPKPHPTIISALHDLFGATCKLFLAPTGLRYFVTINLKNFSSFDKCHKCPPVSPAQASAVIALCLLHADRNVTVAVPGANNEPVVVPLATSMTVQQVVKKLEESGSHHRGFVNPLSSKKKEEYDVFVVISDSSEAVTSFGSYKEDTNLPNAKLINVLLKCHHPYSFARQTSEPGLFFIGGFDSNVPRLIEAFSRGAF